MAFFPPRVSAADRRRLAEAERARLAKAGRKLAPVRIDGRAIASTFWGKAWCDNLESYSDFASRLPRGRTYARQGAILDLTIAAGRIDALVSGSELYEVGIRVAPVRPAAWRAICADCAGGVDSLVELLRGRLSRPVMERLCRQRTGLFPSPAEIDLSCTCPDAATMCKHVAAALYGVGARLDDAPRLLFELRQVDEQDLIARAGRGLPDAAAPPPDQVLAGDLDELSALFGLELAAIATEPSSADRPAPGRRRSGRTPARAGTAGRSSKGSRTR